MGKDVGINSYTLAVITTDKNMNTSGGCPIFYANNDDDLQNKAMLMATFIYRAVLIRRIGDLNELVVLDEKIKSSDTILYAKLEQEKMMGTSFYYIKYFHKHHSRIPRIYSLIYNFLYTYIKVKYTQKKRKSWSRGGN